MTTEQIRVLLEQLIFDHHVEKEDLEKLEENLKQYIKLIEIKKGE
jgi:hypothetical protein